MGRGLFDCLPRAGDDVWDALYRASIDNFRRNRFATIGRQRDRITRYGDIEKVTIFASTENGKAFSVGLLDRGVNPRNVGLRTHGEVSREEEDLAYKVRFSLPRTRGNFPNFPSGNSGKFLSTG
jgi:hypothetical protein